MKTIDKIHEFPTFSKALEMAEELKKHETEGWNYEAVKITSSNKNVIAAYDEIRFIGYW